MSVDTGAINLNKDVKVKKFTQILSSWCFMWNKEVVSVIRLEGIIGKNIKNGLTLESLNPIIEKAFKYSRLAAVCLIINSPGGSPVQSELIASKIRFLAQKRSVPVYSFIEDVGASGGYWLACAGDEIYAAQCSVIGSIGVVSMSFGLHEAISKLGIERRVYAEGKNKFALDPFQPENPAGVKILKNVQKSIYDNFTNYIKERRGHKLTQDDSIIFNGAFWGSGTALDYGLIDGIDTFYSFIQDKFGDNIKLEYIETKKSWFMRKVLAHEVIDRAVELTLDKIEARLLSHKFPRI